MAETGAWTELLRLCVRDLLSREVDARGDGTHTLQQSTTLKADTMRASNKMDSCNIRAALQILQTNTRAPRNIQTAAGCTHWLLLRQTNKRDTEGGPAVLREWMGTWTQAVVPHQTAKLWTAATIAPLDCGPKKAEPGQKLPQPCTRKLRPLLWQKS